MRVLHVYSGNLYGGGDLNWSRIVPGTIRSFLRRERPIIRSDGTFRRDYIYVKDVVLAYLRLAESIEDEQVQGEAFNFGPGSPLTVLEIVAAIQSLMGCEEFEPDIRGTATGEIPHQYLSADKARDRLGWTCQFDRETGLRETIDWYRALFS